MNIPEAEMCASTSRPLSEDLKLEEIHTVRSISCISSVL